MKVLITGATSGIGKATAYEFASHGHDLIICGRRSEKLEELKVEIVEKYEVNVLTLSFDIQKYEDVSLSLIHI